MFDDLKGFVYFIEAPEVGRIKIGWSLDNPDARFAHLDTASPVKLEKRALLRGSQRCERDLHRRFAAYSVKGEWFEAAPELREYIRKWARNWDALLLEGEPEYREWVKTLEGGVKKLVPYIRDAERVAQKRG
jgi:hypothetical protein